MTMSERCDPALCVRNGGRECTPCARTALLDSKIDAARHFLAREQARGTAVTDGRPTILFDLLLPDEKARLLELAGTTVTDEHDPLIAAQAAYKARWVQR